MLASCIVVTFLPWSEFLVEPVPGVQNIALANLNVMKWCILHFFFVPILCSYLCKQSLLVLLAVIRMIYTAVEFLEKISLDTYFTSKQMSMGVVFLCFPYKRTIFMEKKLG